MDAAALFARWSSLAPKRRGTVAGVAGLFVAALVALSLLSHPQRSALFAAPLHPEQLSEVQEQLASWNVAFTPLADNVLVDASHRNDILLKLSMAGVPHEHVETSADVLDKLGALTPQTVIDAQARDGLAGDIALALRGVDGIEDARVIIAPAKLGFFADEPSRDASASVRLRMNGGAQLSGDAIGGIRAFVAAAVPGLSENDVTILDDRGPALGSQSDQPSELGRSLQSALDAALGAGASIVRVHVEYDRRRITSTDVRRAPLSALPIAAVSQDERYGGDGKRYARSEQQVDRGSDTRESVASTDGARVARISAGVLVDASRVSDLAQVKALAVAALGLDRSRGDSVDVEAVAFSHAAVAHKDGWWLAYGAIVPLLPALAVPAAVLIALRWSREPLGAALRAHFERLAQTRTTRAVTGIAPAAVRGALRNEPAHTAAAIISALPAATAAAVLEMYPEHERAAIVRRMQRTGSPLIPDPESFVANA